MDRGIDVWIDEKVCVWDEERMCGWKKKGFLDKRNDV